MKRKTPDWFSREGPGILKALGALTAEELRELLKKAGYERLTGVNPDSLSLRPPKKGGAS